MLVQENYRKHALHLSRQRLHKSNFELSEIYFQDPNGRRELFHVVMVDLVDGWKPNLQIAAIYIVVSCTQLARTNKEKECVNV